MSDELRDALAEIAALPDVRCDEAPAIAQRALAEAGVKRDYANGLPPQIEADIKQATWAFFQSLVETARENPEALRQMFSRAQRQQARNDAMKRDGLVLAKAPAIMDLKRFSWPGKTTN